MAAFIFPSTKFLKTMSTRISVRGTVLVRPGLRYFPRLHSLATKRKERVQTEQAPLTVEQLDTLLEQSNIEEGPVQDSRPVFWSSHFSVIEFLKSKFTFSDRLRGLVLLNVMTLIMSTNFVVVKDAQTTIDPFSFSAARFVVAAIPFLPFITKTRPDRQTIIAGLEIGLWSTLGYLTQGLGLLTTDASRVSFLSALTVILVPFIVGLSGKGVSKLAWVSAGLALFGVSLLSGSGGGDELTSIGGGFSIGDMFSLASAAFIALQVVRTEHYSRLLPSKNCLSLLGLSMLSVASLSTLMTGIMHAEVIKESITGILQSPDSLSMESVISSFSFVPGKALLYTGLISTDVVLLIELLALKVRYLRKLRGDFCCVFRMLIQQMQL